MRGISCYRLWSLKHRIFCNVELPKNGRGLGFRKGRIKTKFCKDAAPKIVGLSIVSYIDSYLGNYNYVVFEKFKTQSKEYFHD